MILDPPYNLSKVYNGSKHRKMNGGDHTVWPRPWMAKVVRTVRLAASIYICYDWQSSLAVYEALSERFAVKNRIT